MQKKIITSILLSFCVVCQVFAQPDTSVRLLVHPAEKDSIMLRWAAANKETWSLGNQYGYVVERYTILRNGELMEDKERITLTANPLKPQPVENWEFYEDVDKYVSIAAECIYGESETLLTGPVAIGRKYKEEQNRFSFALYAADQSPLVARLSGLYLADITVQVNEKYLYSVHIAAPDSVAVDTAFAFTGLSEYLPLPKPLDLTAQWGDKSTLLSWNILYLNHIYNSYIVEKSTDGNNYTSISENASVQAADEGVEPEWAYRTDSLPDNQTTFYYRIRGINAFGETGPPSDSVVGKGRLPITGAPVIAGKEVIENREVKLSWEFPETMNEYISGFRLYRSSKPEGIKRKIYEGNNPATRTYTDISPEQTNYYVLSVHDGETEKFSPGLTYAELIDSIPPAVPAGLTGTIDSLGIVRLSWNENIDKDIHGYRMYRSNRPDFEFLLISPAEITETHFTDSINVRTLNREIYYRLRAVDLRGNHSDFGEMLELKRPDFIPPVSPVIKEIIAEKSGIVLTWYNSSSSDVIRHHIHRKSDVDTVFERIASINMPKIPEKTGVYTDRNIWGGENYLYQVSAEDDNGLHSLPSAPMLAKALGEKQVEQITLKAKATGNDDDRQIVLSWTVNAKKQVEKILIYKAENDAPMRLLGNSTENNFIDKNLTFGKRIKYCVKAVFTDGTTSDFSKEVEVRN